MESKLGVVTHTSQEQFWWIKKKELEDWIENKMDHYIPYRPITDSLEAQEVRKVLGELLTLLTENNKKEKGGDSD